MAEMTKITIELSRDGSYRRIYNDGVGKSEYDFDSVRRMARALSREAVTLWTWLDSVGVIKPDEPEEGGEK